MKDKIHSLTERFVKDVREVIAHEMLKLLENIVTGVAAPSQTPSPKNGRKKKTKKKNQAELDYQRNWRMTQKIKAGKQLSSEDTKWRNGYLKKRQR